MAEGSTALSGSMEADVQGNGPVGSSEEVTDDSTPSISDSSDVEDLDSDVELPLEEFPPDEVEKADTTAQQYYEEGRDLQGIPWERLQVCVWVMVFTGQHVSCRGQPDSCTHAALQDLVSVGEKHVHMRSF